MFVKIKKLIEDRVHRFGQREKIEVGLIDKIWGDVIGSILKNDKNNRFFLELKSSKPIKLQNGVLTIEAKNQAVSSEISIIGYDLIDKINQELGRRAVKRLFFKLKKYGQK
jgi:hypothetical protein